MTRTAILLAGQRPGTDPLAAHFGQSIKALVPIAGEPMVRRPARALAESGSVGDIIVMAQQTEPIVAALKGIAKVAVRKSRGSIAETLLVLCDDAATPWPLLVTTADHALLTPAMIDRFAAAAEGADIAIGVVERGKLERRLPGAKRTWLSFRGEQVTGANLFALASPEAARAIRLWRSVEQDRKSAWRMLALLGPVMLPMALLRLLSLDDVLARLSLKLGVALRAVRLDDPLAGVDVDKLADHALVEAIIAGRA